MKNADMPAMPELVQSDEDRNNGGTFFHQSQGGLTKLEEAAFRAMQGILASGQYNGEIRRNLAEIAEDSIHCANSLLAELESTK